MTELINRNKDALSLRAEAKQRRAEKPLRQRDLAIALGVSEAELIAAFVGADTTADTAEPQVVRLTADFPAIMEQVPTLGKVMALTRNEAVVHERKGVYEKISHNGSMGIALGKDIDLRIFYSKWASAFAVSDNSARGILKSLQFYDLHGDAVHKIYVTDDSDVAAYDALVNKFRAAEQTAALSLVEQPAASIETPDSAIDVAAFQAGWLAMTDTHDFNGLMRKFGLSRQQALRLAPEGLVVPLANDAIDAVLESASTTGLPIMVFVGSRGMIQIHTGPVAKIAPMDNWLNVLDPDFNLHLRRDLVAFSYIVRKPTDDGIVTSLELFDADGQNIAMLFGARKPGQPELSGWSELLARIAQARPATDIAVSADQGAY